MTDLGPAGKCMIVCQVQQPTEHMIGYAMLPRQAMMEVHIDAHRMVVIQNKRQKVVPLQRLFVILEERVGVKRLWVQLQKNKEMEQHKVLVPML